MGYSSLGGYGPQLVFGNCHITAAAVGNHFIHDGVAGCHDWLEIVPSIGNTMLHPSPQYNNHPCLRFESTFGLE